MKKTTKYIVFLFLVLISRSSYSEYRPVNGENDYCANYTISDSNEKTAKAQTVYICTGPYAYAYHSIPNCPGLSNCRGQINYTDEYSARSSYGRKPCCRCWSNVIGNCGDDNPYAGSGGGGGGGGGGAGEAYVYLGLIMIASSAIILSNDVYFYPAISFYKPFNNQKYNRNYYNNYQTNIGTGFTFGLRKTFKNCALEYGASYFNYNYSYNDPYYGYYDRGLFNQIGLHLNFIHHIFYNKTKEGLRYYIGPSINSKDGVGFGGIIGAEMKLVGRLKFDVRYELTTQSNELKAGLIFNYQKKYFWRKNK